MSANPSLTVGALIACLVGSQAGLVGAPLGP
jgi:hypothetical protein